MTGFECEVITEFCRGAAPSQIDKRHILVGGTARKIITAWWYDDKWNRTGRIERFLGKDWKKVKIRTRW